MANCHCLASFFLKEMGGAIKKRNPYQFFSVASDIMVLRGPDTALEVLLIQRKNPPHQGAWALPGGFVDRHEDALTAAKRELSEETGVKASKLVEFGSFSDPNRDPRGRVVTISYYTRFPSNHKAAIAGDDAGGVQWFSIRRLPKLAFDHREMIQLGLKSYRRDRKTRSVS